MVVWFSLLPHPNTIMTVLAAAWISQWRPWSWQRLDTCLPVPSHLPSMGQRCGKLGLVSIVSQVECVPAIPWYPLPPVLKGRCPGGSYARSVRQLSPVGRVSVPAAFRDHWEPPYMFTPQGWPINTTLHIHSLLLTRKFAS